MFSVRFDKDTSQSLLAQIEVYETAESTYLDVNYMDVTIHPSETEYTFSSYPDLFGRHRFDCLYIEIKAYKDILYSITA